MVAAEWPLPFALAGVSFDLIELVRESLWLLTANPAALGDGALRTKAGYVPAIVLRDEKRQCGSPGCRR
jgi:hypothetical protein